MRHGQYAAAFAACGYQVVAVDRQIDLLWEGVARSDAVHWVLADLRRLPLADRFDGILARGVLNDMVAPSDLEGALLCVAGVLNEDGRFIADVREREAHRARVAARPVIERSAGDITFRAERIMDDEGLIVSREQFARSGTWSPPFEFKMRTFTEKEVYRLWQGAGLEIVSVEPSFGPKSRLTDRLVVVARRRR